MSDLFCAATVLVARHAEAEYDVPGVASDSGGSLSLRGRERARRLGAELRDRRVAAIWCSDMARAVQTAEIVAAVLEVPVRVRPGLREFGVGALAGSPIMGLDAVFTSWVSGDLAGGCPGAETGHEVVARMRTELESVADQHRGETVLVVSHGGVIGVVLPRLAGNVADDFAVGRAVDNCGTCELAVDADGWVLRSWNGGPLAPAARS
jgi:broad specificity phosphatase PhoE